MIKLTVMTLLLSVSISAFAQANCGVCDQNLKVTQSLGKLKYSSAADQEVGMDKAEEALNQLEASRKALRAPKAPQKEISASVLNMIFASAPYDVESQNSQVLFDMIAEFRILREMYEDQTLGTGISCAQRLVKSQVAEITCNENIRRKKKLQQKDFEGDDSCIQKFNYETCLRGPSSVSPKSPSTFAK